MTARDELGELLARRSVLTGSFTLASGRTADVYVDTKLTSTGARAMTLIGPLFLDLFREKGWWKPDAVVGPTLAADPLLAAISYASAILGDPLDHIIVRKEAKGHGTGKWLEGNLEGVREVICIDDVWTTGGSTVKAIEAVRAAGIEVVAVAALVDREQGARAALHPLPTASLYTLAELRAIKHRLAT